MRRPWAFWRRVQYAGALSVVLALAGVAGYFTFFYAPASCFDGKQNGGERGIDCGGACARVCARDAGQLAVRWAAAFRVAEGQYNAVAYVENQQTDTGSPALPYSFHFYDKDGALIASRSGVSVMPPGGVTPIFEGRIALTEEPARTEIEFVPVENWEKAAASRGQFEVRSRTLVSADARPRLSAVLYNTALREAERVEVVATIFDRAGTPLTASAGVVPRIAGRAEQEVALTWPEPIATTLRSCEVPTDVMLAIDLSGSMNDEGGNPPQPITAALEAAATFIGLLRPGDQAGVVGYASAAALSRMLSGAHTETAARVRALRIEPAEERGATNIGNAILAARAELRSARHSEDARSVLVLLTDGKATAPADDPEGHARTAAAAVRTDGVTMFTIGLGSGADRTLLAALAEDDERTLHAPDSAALAAAYGSVSTALCEEGPAVIEILPKVPFQRAGTL